MRISILGNVRFIGRVVAESAVKQGHDVWVIHTGSYSQVVEGAVYRVAERSNAGAIAAHAE